MKAVLKMMWMNIKLAWRIKIAFFFTFVFPLGFFFIYGSLFAHGSPVMVAGMMAPLISLSVISSALFGLGIQLVVMRERDVLRRYHLSPVTALQMVLARLLGNYALFMPVVVLQFVLAVGIYHMPLQGSLWGLFVDFTLGYLAVGAIGMVIAGAFNTVQEAQVVTQIIFFALLFLSGTTVPLAMLPHLVQRLAPFLPPTLMIVAGQGLMLMGDPLALHWPEMVCLVLTFAAALWLAVALFRWEKDAPVTRRNRLQALLALAPLLLAGIWLNASPLFQRNNLRIMMLMSGEPQHQAAPARPSDAPAHKIDPSQIPHA
jgi:ABC-2 type transport system permease protein